MKSYIFKFYINFCFLFIGFITQMSAAPVVTSVHPTNGSFNGGNVVVIMGSGFTGVTAVDFGLHPAAFVFISDTMISATAPPGTPGTVDVVVSVGAQTSPLSRADFYTYTQDSWRGIISGITPNQVTLFDTATNTITNTIALPTDSPSNTVSPDGTRIYTANSGIPSVSVIDTATNTIIATIPTTVGTGAFDIIVSPNGQKIYVSNFTSGFVTVINAATNTVDTNIFVAPSLGALAITPDGTTVYVASFATGAVTTINTATNVVGSSVFVGPAPGNISITPDGTKAFVSTFNHISVIDVATFTLSNIIFLPPGSGAYGSSILPNGLTLYVSNIYTDTVTVIDVATEAITDTIAVMPGSGPFWVVSTPDSKKVYVANLNTNDVTPIDVATNTAGAPVAHIAGAIQDISMSPDQAPVASFTVAMQPEGYSSLFNASASVSPIGTIVLYEWDFGDGNTLATNTPIVMHNYNMPGMFIATLTVTNSAGTSTAKVFSSRFMSNNGGPQATVSQSVTVMVVPPLPPTDFTGCVKKNKFLNETGFYLRATWKASICTNVAYYRIYRNNKIVGSVLATDHHLTFKIGLRYKQDAAEFEIASVANDGLESAHVPIVIVKCTHHHH